MVFTPEQLEKYARVMAWGLERSRSGAFAPGDVVTLGIDGLGEQRQLCTADL